MIIDIISVIGAIASVASIIVYIVDKKEKATAKFPDHRLLFFN